MATRRFKSITMKFGVPLSVPGSRHVEWCYGMHGKGFSGSPEAGAAIDLVLLNPLRQVWIAPGHYPDRHAYRTDAVERGSGWRILGWRMSDGSMPLGDYDAIDPELAQLVYLPLPNRDDPAVEHGCGDERLTGAKDAGTTSRDVADRALHPKVDVRRD